MSSSIPPSVRAALAVLNAGMFPKEAAASVPEVLAVAAKKGRGRPKGSKNKPKVGEDGGEVPPAKKPRMSAATSSTGAAKGKTSQAKGLSVKAVNEILKAHGATTGVSNCLKAAILHGKIKLLKPKDDPNNEFGLDQVLLKGECEACDEELSCTIKDILHQPDYAGMDYEDGCENATLRCPDEDCGAGVYVTEICQGSAHLDSGKFHNHCTKCPSFGTCIGDYREAHCRKCGGHYYNGGFHGGKCHRCHPGY